ncbi:MAG TPA: PASTA domain-containing protein [Terriglobales bacterium]|nr:PASTA domain-containing protein [Terriglobales bacterium]
MRRLVRYVVRTLVLAVVFMASALTAMRFAIHGRQTTIPNLVGLTPIQAERLLADHGLVFDKGESYFSSDVPAGHIMSQAPQPGVPVRRGWRVRVAESMGPQRVVIPDLIGTNERAAEINIQRRGLEVGSLAMATIPGAPADQIVAQSPPPNAVNVSGLKISLLIAAPEEPPSFVMPDLTGQSEDSAINEIVNAGLRVGDITSQPVTASQPAPAGNANQTPAAAPQANANPAAPSATRTVVKTIPAAGQRVWQGQGIALQVTQ